MGLSDRLCARCGRACLPASLAVTLFASAHLVLPGSIFAADPEPGWNEPVANAGKPEDRRADARLPQDSLEILLERLARVAQLYNDNALRFSCGEEITYTLFGASGRVQDRRKYSLEYMYVYEVDEELADEQLADNEESARRGRLADYRTIHDEDAPEGSYREIDLDELALPNYLRQAYSWAFIFENARQARYEFEIVGEERVHGIDALVLKFDPIPPYVKRVNDWFGRAWIDKESAQILRVEARSSDSLTNDEPAETAPEEHGEGGVTFSVTSVTTDFGIQKNGMRFPSHAVLTASVSRRFAEGAHVIAALIGDVGEYETEVRTVFRVDQTYDDYRFFNVRSEAEIRDFVLGIRQSEELNR